MSSSSAAVQSPQNPSLSDDDEEMEYEEIEEEIEVEEEIEEEIEVEEEFEVEEDEDEEVEDDDDDDDDDESEIGEALTPVREENQINDSNQIAEAEHEEQIKSGPVTSGISVSNPLPDIPITQEIVGDCRTSDSREEGQSHTGGERTSKDDDPKVSFDDRTKVNDVKINCFVDVDAALTTREKDNAIISDVAETDQNALEEKITPRLHVPQVRLRESHSSAEFDGENKRQKIVCEFHARGWCIKGRSCRFLHTDGESDATVRGEVNREASSSACTPPQHSGVDSKLNVETEKLIIRSDNLLGAALLPAGGESRRQTSYSDNSSHYAMPLVKGSSIDRSGTYHGDQSGFAVASHDNHQNSKSSFEIKLQEMINKKSDIVQNDHRFSESSHSRPRQPLSFGLSSWNISAFGTQSHLEKSSLEHCASVSFPLQRSNSPFSFTESQSRNRIFRDIEPTMYKTKMSFGDWEPSVPFCPSHAITRNLLLKENLYDPIHDSIEQTYGRDVRMKFSHSGHGSSVMNTHLPSNSSQGEKLLNPAHVEETSSGYGNRLNFDKSKHKTEPEVDGSGKMDETVPDINIDGHVQSESKAVKYFQAALIEFVKELVKPTWREGLLSKDAHKIIVKKASDKVLSTLEPHQIPNTPESIKLYLSSSQPKLAKLVEAYIDKYGKF